MSTKRSLYFLQDSVCSQIIPDWIRTRCLHAAATLFGLHKNLLFMTAAIFNRCAHQFPGQEEKVAVVGTFMACKLDNYLAEALKIHNVCDGAEEMDLKVLACLQWKLVFMTLNQFTCDPVILAVVRYFELYSWHYAWHGRKWQRLWHTNIPWCCSSSLRRRKKNCCICQPCTKTAG